MSLLAVKHKPCLEFVRRRNNPADVCFSQSEFLQEFLGDPRENPRAEISVVVPLVVVIGLELSGFGVVGKTKQTLYQVDWTLGMHTHTLICFSLLDLILKYWKRHWVVVCLFLQCWVSVLFCVLWCHLKKSNLQQKCCRMNSSRWSTFTKVTVTYLYSSLLHTDTMSTIFFCRLQLCSWLLAASLCSALQYLRWPFVWIVFTDDIRSHSQCSKLFSIGKHACVV